MTEKGRTLAPIIASIARWWVHDGMASALEVDASRFTETSALSVLESLPNLLREERARDARVVFEIRLTGEGGGVWTVEIDDGECRRPCRGFAEGADVRYTASARDWCAVALGLLDAQGGRRQRAASTRRAAPRRWTSSSTRSRGRVGRRTADCAFEPDQRTRKGGPWVAR